MSTSGCARWMRAMPSGAAISEISETLRRAGVLQERDGVRGRVAGREHRVEQEHVALGDVVRELDVVLDRLERLLVAVEADEADARDRRSARARRRACPSRRGGSGRRRPSCPGCGRRGVRSSGVSTSTSSSPHVLRRLVGQEQRQLVDEPPEHLRVGVDVAQQSELVPDERVRDLVTTGIRRRRSCSRGSPGRAAGGRRAPASALRARRGRRRRCERVDDDRGDLAEVVLVEAAHRRGRRADPDARGDHRRPLVERHRVAVHGQPALVRAGPARRAPSTRSRAGRAGRGACRCRR